MGLDFRKRSGNISDGSTLIVSGQPKISQKIFQVTFTKKISKYQKNIGPSPIEPTPQPTPQPNV